MPAEQRGSAYRLDAGRWGLRYYDLDGKRRRVSPFPSKSAAMRHYRTVIEPELRGDPTPMPDLPLAEFAPVYLERHGAIVGPPRSQRSAIASSAPSVRSGTWTCAS